MNPLCLIGVLYSYVLFARVIVSFVILFRQDWTPRGGVRAVIEMVYALTDPPVNFLRRFIPPLRSGAMAIDLAFIVWALLVFYVLRPALCQLGLALF